MAKEMNIFKQLRFDKEKSLRKVAEESGVGAATIMRLENGGKAYELTLAKLAKYYGIALEDLKDFETINPKSVPVTLINPTGTQNFAAVSVVALVAAPSIIAKLLSH